MKNFTIVAASLFLLTVATSSCMREKFNHGIPRTWYNRPHPPQKFVQHDNNAVKDVVVARAK